MQNYQNWEVIARLKGVNITILKEIDKSRGVGEKQ